MEDVVGKSCHEIGASFGIAIHKILQVGIEEDPDAVVPPLEERGSASS